MLKCYDNSVYALLPEHILREGMCPTSKKGDGCLRPDGIRVKDAEAMYMLIPYFLTKRYDAMNMITIDIPVEPMREFINEKRKEGHAISHLAMVLAAYVRVAAEYPLINRFIGNKKIFQHKDLTVSMVVLRPNSEDSTMSKVNFDMSDDIFKVQERIDAYINENRNNDDTSFDKTMDNLLKIPGFAGFAIGILRFMDKHGLIPNVLVKLSPFHASLLISNLASIRTNHIYHHIYQFGTTSIGITIGNLREVPRRLRTGEIVHDKCIPMGIVMDERICSGHYLAKAFARIKEYLANPELLVGPPKFKVYTAKEAAKLRE